MLFNLQRHVLKLAKFLLVVSGRQGWIGNTPVVHDRLTWEDRQDLARSQTVMTIEVHIFEFIPRLGARSPASMLCSSRNTRSVKGLTVPAG